MSDDEVMALLNERDRLVRENAELRADLARRPAAPGGKYRCGCPVVASDKIKGFCPEHHDLIAEAD